MERSNFFFLLFTGLALFSLFSLAFGSSEVATKGFLHKGKLLISFKLGCIGFCLLLCTWGGWILLVEMCYPCGGDCDLSLEAGIWAWRLGFEPGGWDLSLEARIWVSRLGFELWGKNLSLKARIWTSRLGLKPQGWDLSLEAGIWASRLQFEPQG